jgi:plastocyanin
MLRSVLFAALVLAVSPAASETFEVRMAGGLFAPTDVAARVGDTIRFINDDTMDHQVFVPDADFAFDLRSQPPGEAREIVLLKAVNFEVECVLHDMGLIAVEVLP